MGRSLDTDDFEEFFRVLHSEDGVPGPGPFPWQIRLVDRVAKTGEWPSLLDLPTGSGKTAALDAAVFLLALRQDQPRRVVFVVDRRVVVHQAAERAAHIAQRLQEAHEGVLFEVAQRLRALAGLDQSHSPLEYAELRGGIARDNDWARRPDVPAVIVSTVDQVGSRLLFRGYGVSSGMRPVHAGLLGNDVLYLLDEVHLAQPFAETLSAISRYYRPPKEAGLPVRWAVVELSATPSSRPPEDRVLRLDDDDLATPILARRLTASKPARTRLVKVTGKDQAVHRAALAAAAVEEARALLTRPWVRTLGVVVNRVDTAVRVHRMLDDLGVDAVLLTGRMRPLDRDLLLSRYKARLRTGRVREQDTPPLVVVATQAVEAGADIDLDGLVTECAALDALVQRFGRVDRAGDCADQGQPAASIIIATSADIAETADDPVYGDRLRRTWAWLQERPIDFGITALTVPARTRETLSSTQWVAPYLMPSHLDRWVQTSATPDADPDPAHWLHGAQANDMEVNVVWRADVLPQAIPARARSAELDQLIALVSLCRPGSGEAMSLPAHAVRAWLAGLHSGEKAITSFSDTVLDSSEDAETNEKEAPAIEPALLWNGDNSSVANTTRHISPGSTIVVPATYGGIRADNWDPTSRTPVSDLGTAVQAKQRGKAVLRLYPAPPSSDVGDFDDEVVAHWLDELTTKADDSEHTELKLLHTVASELKTHSRRRIVRLAMTPSSSSDQPHFETLVVHSRRKVESLLRRHRIIDTDSDPSTSSFLGVAVLLKDHLSDVETWAQNLASSCGFPSDIVNDLALAGRLHDLGKVDPRFQLFLRGGEIITDTAQLAKSAVPATDYRRRKSAETVARYPMGTRHELASVALVENDRELRDQANDWDLVLHLIASHHGYARPFVPVVLDPSPQQLRAQLDGRVLAASSDHGLLRLDSGVPQRFWRCVRRYGWYGLAWLEATLRLADHRASEERAR